MNISACHPSISSRILYFFILYASLNLSLSEHSFADFVDEETALHLRVSYLSARMSSRTHATEGYLSVDGMTLGMTVLILDQTAFKLGLGLGIQGWHEVFHQTPGLEQLKPTPSVDSETSVYTYPSLTPPSESSINQKWSVLSTPSLSMHVRSSSAWPSTTFTIGGLWRTREGEFQQAQEREKALTYQFKLKQVDIGSITPWSSLHLSWRKKDQFIRPWLYGRWGGVGLGSELMNAQSEVSLRGHMVSGGIGIGRTQVGLFWLWHQTQQGLGAGITLPLSAPLYLCSSAWLSIGELQDRIFSIGLRWTGEELLQEQAASPSDQKQIMPTSPSAPPLGPSRQPSTPLNPLSPNLAPTQSPNQRSPL